MTNSAMPMRYGDLSTMADAGERIAADAAAYRAAPDRPRRPRRSTVACSRISAISAR